MHGFDFVYYKNHPSSPGEIDDEVKGGIDDQEEMVEASDAQDPWRRDVVHATPEKKGIFYY